MLACIDSECQIYRAPNLPLIAAMPGKLLQISSDAPDPLLRRLSSAGPLFCIRLAWDATGVRYHLQSIYMT